jgi:hypothetical protein
MSMHLLGASFGDYVMTRVDPCRQSISLPRTETFMTCQANQSASMIDGRTNANDRTLRGGSDSYRRSDGWLPRDYGNRPSVDRRASCLSQPIALDAMRSFTIIDIVDFPIASALVA